MVLLRASQNEAVRLLVSSSFPAITIFYCVLVRPIDWVFISISVFASALSINYWVYPIISFRLYADVLMSIICVISIFATGLMKSGCQQLGTFCFGLVCFGMSSYCWRLLYGKNAVENRGTDHIGPIFTFFFTLQCFLQ